MKQEIKQGYYQTCWLKMKTKIKIYILVLLLYQGVYSQFMLIPMDLNQSNHLKAYGITYWILEQDVSSEWLLNYRGGSFLFTSNELFENEPPR